MKKRIFIIAGALVAAVLIFLAVRYIRYEHYPVQKDPSPEWDSRVSAMDAQREPFFVDSDGVLLEAELFIPNGGSDVKAAAVFSPGSGDALYQNYAYGLIETYVLDVFLQRDMIVLLVNKRGMGESDGNYVKNDFQGRADDLYAAVQSIQGHPSVDAENIGLIGHSQGGWIIGLTASQRDDIAFFISLAGPTTSVERNAEDNYYHYLRCQGYDGEELDKQIAKRMKSTQFGIKIGKLTNFGMFGFDARIFSYDPTEALKTVTCPGLLLYAENDDQVTPSVNLDRLYSIFDNNPPENLTTVIIKGATHAFRLVNDPCDSWVNVADQSQSEELIIVLNDWLGEHGY